MHGKFQIMLSEYVQVVSRLCMMSERMGLSLIWSS